MRRVRCPLTSRTEASPSQNPNSLHFSNHCQAPANSKKHVENGMERKRPFGVNMIEIHAMSCYNTQCLWTFWVSSCMPTLRFIIMESTSI